MRSDDIAWVAGILEGEGCFDYNRSPKYPRIRLEMTDEDVVRRVSDVIGGRITEPKRRNDWAQSYLLTLNGAEAHRAMTAVLPWMGQRRKEKIERLLASGKEVC